MAATATAASSSTNYGFVIDNRRCIGCHACTVACKAEHSDPIGINKTWVSYVEKGVFPDVSREFHVLRCNHCADAPCVEICPTACLVTRGDGIVDFDPGRCIGCKACMQACPYDAITIHPDSNTATKCNYCSHRVEVGREPACVIVCPAEAIIAGDLNDPTSKIARLVAREDVSVRKPEKGTRPKLYYIEGDAAVLQPSAARMSVRTLWGSKPADGLLSPVPAERKVADELASDAASIFRWRKNGTTSASTLASLEERARPRRTYDIAQRHATTWGWKVSAYLFTKSIAAGLFLVPAILFFQGKLTAVLRNVTQDPTRPPVLSRASGEITDSFSIGAFWAIVALAVTGALLVADLKRPERFLWVLIRPQWRSWLVRGAYIIAGYGAVLVAWLLFRPKLDSSIGILLAAAGGVLAAGTAAYSGWLFGQAKGRDLWQSPLAPLHLLVQGIVAGAACFLCVSVDLREMVLPIFFVALAANALLLVLDIWGKHPTADAAAAAHLMRTGRRGNMLFAGVFLVGHLFPVFLLLLGWNPAAIAAGAMALLGVLVYEHLWVEAPQRIPLA